MSKNIFDKRGVRPVVGAALALIVILAMVGVTPQGRDLAKGVLNIGKDKLNQTTNRTVPVPIDLSAEDIIVLQSMDALTCAVNTVAKGKTNFADTSFCPEQDPEEEKVVAEDENSVSYGPVEVESCWGFGQKGKATLPKSEEDATKYLAEIVSLCYAKGKTVDRPHPYICAKINTSQLEDDVSISEGEIESALGAIKDGNELTGGSWYEWNREEVGLDSIDNEDDDYCVYYHDRRWKEPRYEKIRKSDGVVTKVVKWLKNRVEDAKVTWRIVYHTVVDPNKVFMKECPTGRVIKGYLSGYQCAVDGFYLPQELTWFETYIESLVGLGNPKYLAFYEMFPQSEMKYWQGPDLISLGTKVLIAGATSGVFAFIGAPGAKKAAAEVAETAVKEVVEHGAVQAAKETAEQVGVKYMSKELAETAVKKSVVKDGIGAGVKDIGEGASKEVVEKIGKNAQETLDKKFAEAMSETVDPKIPIKNTITESGEKINQEISERVVARSLTPQQAGIMRETVENAQKEIADSFNRLVGEGLDPDQAFKQAVTEAKAKIGTETAQKVQEGTLDAASATYVREAFESVEKEIGDIALTPQGFIHPDTIIGRSLNSVGDRLTGEASEKVTSKTITFEQGKL
ncbi:hypothetical protein ACFLZN_02415, partial [Nanoarchaeota archaeon]